MLSMELSCKEEKAREEQARVFLPLSRHRSREEHTSWHSGQVRGSTEVTHEPGGHCSYGYSQVGAAKANTNNDRTSHQTPRWLDADDFGPLLLRRIVYQNHLEALSKNTDSWASHPEFLI